MAGKRYAYFRVGGIHFTIRLEAERQCIRVVMGATAGGKKERVAAHDGFRESEHSWKERLLDLKDRGLTQCAERHWRVLNGATRLADVIRGVPFIDGEKNKPPDPAASTTFDYTSAASVWDL